MIQASDTVGGLKVRPHKKQCPPYHEYRCICEGSTYIIYYVCPYIIYCVYFMLYGMFINNLDEVKLIQEFGIIKFESKYRIPIMDPTKLK